MPKSLKSLKDGGQCDFDKVCQHQFAELDSEIKKQTNTANSLVKRINVIEPKLIKVCQCLMRSEKDPDIRSIKLASLLGTYKAVLASNLPSNLPHLGHFCTFYYTSLYQTYINKVLGIKDSEHLNTAKLYLEYQAKRTQIYEFFTSHMMLFNEAFRNIIQEEDNFKALYDIVLFLDFMKRKYSYNKPNDALTDFLMSYSNWKDNVLYDGGEGDVMPLYSGEYKRGCNCICGTVAIATMLRLLSTRGRIAADPDSFTLVDDQTNYDNCHIFLRWNNVNIETTSDIIIITDNSKLGIIKHLMNIFSFSVVTENDLIKSNAYNILSVSHLEKIIISNYVARHPIVFPFWHKAKLLDDQSHDMTVIQMPGTSMAELFYRCHRMFMTFPTSKHLVDVIVRRLQELYIDGGLKLNVHSEWVMDPKPQYIGMNVIETGKQLFEKLDQLTSENKENKTLVSITAAFRSLFG